MGSIRYRIVQKDGQEIVEEIHKIIAYRFSVSDVEDPEIYAAEPIWKWQQTDAGKFIIDNAIETPIFHKNINSNLMGYEYVVTAELEKKKLSEYYLKFGQLK